MNSSAFSAALVAAIAATALVAEAAPMTMMTKPLAVTMAAQNGSGETGAAMLRDTARGLVVTVHLKNAKGPQPMHLHKGTCAKLDPKPAYALHNVVNGMSVTTVPGVTIGELRGKFAINAHKSTTDIATYVSCGDVK
ncbi:hypothetical protein WPS_04060 [Vulcanimicrobium alpinum]|uniref:Superoxide dismutase copper/zinc binding domain-containing protein n=1 Tax=Vulcanimicrobium alpinum TaxID=3016050 RepID=A0AAN2C7V4_UNVUL|nr:hypothetical protein [Vulcanimicrobium alpinum]BDE05130.1 hypothetical protein WPS_04060 [Vulcanimicrobium alpinum]